MTRRHTPPEGLRREQSRQRWVIADAISANFMIIFWEQRGSTSQANYFREMRDRKLAEFTSITPPKDTII